LMQWIKDELGKEIKYTNNGELTQRLTVEKLKKKHSSFPRNELVADVFYKAAYIEAWGHGTIKMVDECKKAGLPEPNFEEESGGMLVTFRKDILTEEYLQKMDLNERQIKAVLYIKEKGSVVSSVYQRINDTTSKTATRDLVDLVTKGILENKGGAIRGAIYMLKKD
jgi:ATP-dependent DNA helicase RecG